MSPLVKYSLARLGLFVAAAAVLFVLPFQLDPFIRLIIALVVTAILSLLLLGGLRSQVAEQLAGSAERRTQRRDKLRAALSGDDEAKDK